MTIQIGGPKGSAWLTGKVAKLLTKAYRRGIGDDVIVAVFGELPLTSQASAEAVLASLKELTAIDEDDDGSDPAYG